VAGTFFFLSVSCHPVDSTVFGVDPWLHITLLYTVLCLGVPNVGNKRNSGSDKDDDERK
jgi:hypothetical protein